MSASQPGTGESRGRGQPLPNLRSMLLAFGPRALDEMPAEATSRCAIFCLAWPLTRSI